jgi:hypothetical protein
VVDEVGLALNDLLLLTLKVSSLDDRDVEADLLQIPRVSETQVLWRHEDLHQPLSQEGVKHPFAWTESKAKVIDWTLREQASERSVDPCSCNYKLFWKWSPLTEALVVVAGNVENCWLSSGTQLNYLVLRLV